MAKNNKDIPKRLNHKKDKFIPRKIKDNDDTKEPKKDSTASLKTRAKEYKDEINKKDELEKEPVLSPQLQLAPQRKNYYRGTKIRRATELKEDTHDLSSSNLKIIPLGGLCEIGKNMNVFEYDDDMIIGDCGQMFADDEEPGIDCIIPDFSYVLKNQDKLRAIFLTHGHEDHIGGMPYLLKDLDKHVPIYAGKMAVELLRNKLKEFHLEEYLDDIHTVLPNDVVEVPSFSVEFVTVNHSIADAFSLAIRTPVGLVIQSGDWKVDYTPVNGKAIDLNRFAELGDEGVLCFIGESTNVERKGYTVSETSVGKTFEEVFSKAEGRVFVATFASNTSRVQQIITAAENDGRKVALVGRSMLNVFNASLKLGYIDMKDDTLIELNQVNDFPDDEVCVISTGSQGEPMSALTRMAYAEHRSVEITEGDTVIISATPIPGNEKPIYTVINELYKRGAKVVYSEISDVHVSGHANREELKLMLNLLKPKYFIPAHGEYRMLYMHGKLAQEQGVEADHIFILNNGDILELNRENARISGYTSADSILIDGTSATKNDSVVLMQRKDLSNNGVLSIAVSLDKDHNLMARPQVLSYGAFLDTDQDSAYKLISDFVINYIEENKHNDKLVKNLRTRKFRYQLQNFFKDHTGRRPITLVSVIEVND